MHRRTVFTLLIAVLFLALGVASPLVKRSRPVQSYDTCSALRACRRPRGSTSPRTS
jgi:hypothetical protein